MKNPDKRISEVELISEDDIKKLEEFNSTEVSIPDCLVQDFFEKQVRQTPEKTAVITKTQSLTYKELDERANKLSRHLINNGVVTGDVVGVFIERSAEMVISILGILKSGCCYLPLDPAFPPERLSFMYEDSGTKVLISDESLKDKFGYFTNASFVIIDEKSSLINKYPVEKPDIKLNPRLPAYILYTSGSTGKPKGVKVHHQAVVNLINSMSKTPGVNKNDILLAVVTISFDMSVFELFLPLSNGATIVVASSEDTTDGNALIKLIDKYNITILQAGPSLFYILLVCGWKGKSNLKALCGGETLTSNIVRQILPKVGELWNCYGPTETTVFSTCIRITDSEEKVLIGKPIDNTKIYILDKYNKLLPPGIIGEVCIGGLGVVKGYINQPDLTSERFIRFDNNQIIYKTGDLGTYHMDGNIELFGRIDNQIKIRGFRIEPAEIEVMLSQLKGINEAIVKAHRFGENDERLVAYLNVSDDFSLDTKELHRRIKEKLPSFMIPSVFKVMKGFPKTSNGKTDRKALHYEINESGCAVRDNIKTLTSTEKKIHKIWCEVLKTEDISVIDNFFEIGGNSLIAISVMSKIDSAFNIGLGLRVFFDSPKIKDLAEAIDILKQETIEGEPVKRAGREKSKIAKGEI